MENSVTTTSHKLHQSNPMQPHLDNSSDDMVTNGENNSNSRAKDQSKQHGVDDPIGYQRFLYPGLPLPAITYQTVERLEIEPEPPKITPAPKPIVAPKIGFSQKYPQSSLITTAKKVATAPNTIVAPKPTLIQKMTPSPQLITAAQKVAPAPRAVMTQKMAPSSQLITTVQKVSTAPKSVVVQKIVPSPQLITTGKKVEPTPNSAALKTGLPQQMALSPLTAAKITTATATTTTTTTTTSAAQKVTPAPKIPTMSMNPKSSKKSSSNIIAYNELGYYNHISSPMNQTYHPLYPAPPPYPPYHYNYTRPYTHAQNMQSHTYNYAQQYVSVHQEPKTQPIFNRFAHSTNNKPSKQAHTLLMPKASPVPATIVPSVSRQNPLPNTSQRNQKNSAIAANTLHSPRTLTHNKIASITSPKATIGHTTTLKPANIPVCTARNKASSTSRNLSKNHPILNTVQQFAKNLHPQYSNYNRGSETHRSVSKSTITQQVKNVPIFASNASQNQSEVQKKIGVHSQLNIVEQLDRTLLAKNGNQTREYLQFQTSHPSFIATIETKKNYPSLILNPISNLSKKQIKKLPVVFAYRLDDDGTSETAAISKSIKYKAEREAALNQQKGGTLAVVQKRKAQREALALEGKIRAFSTRVLPRVQDEIYPAGWMMEKVERHVGETVGRVDKYWYSPLTQKKFRSRIEVRRFLDLLKLTDGDESLAFQYIKAPHLLKTMSQKKETVKSENHNKEIQKKKPTKRDNDMDKEKKKSKTIVDLTVKTGVSKKPEKKKKDKNDKNKTEKTSHASRTSLFTPNSSHRKSKKVSKTPQYSSSKKSRTPSSIREQSKYAVSTKLNDKALKQCILNVTTPSNKSHSSTSTKDSKKRNRTEYEQTSVLKGSIPATPKQKEIIDLTPTKSSKRIKERKESITPETSFPKSPSSTKSKSSKKSKSNKDRDKSSKENKILRNIKLDPSQLFLGPAPHLPEGWILQIIPVSLLIRDKIWYSPKDRLKFKSLNDVKRFLAILPAVNGNEKKAFEMRSNTKI